jgi:hypothetical protein
MSDREPNPPELAPRAGGVGVDLLLLACVVLAAVLRARGLSTQIPIDDEWHGLDVALSRDAWFLFTHFSRAGANSVPFNLCLRGLLVSVGWSEVTIALPSLLAGVALVWSFPRWVRRRFGAEAAVISAAWLAIAPFLVFYSRTARCYSLLLLCESLALVALGEWLRQAQRRARTAFVVWGALAIWLHATALPPLLGAVGVAVGLRCRRSPRGAAPPAPRARQVALAGLAMVALAGALWLPALVHALPSPVHGAARFSLRTFTGMLELWSGTATVALQIVWALTALLGLARLARIAYEQVALWIAALGAGAIAVLVTRPNLTGTAAIFARYLLPVFPLVSLALGVAVQQARRRVRAAWQRHLLSGTCAIVLLAFYFLGPLPRIHTSPNSFTKHPAFQFNYADQARDHSRPDPLDPSSAGLRRSELQAFYASLGAEPGSAPVIEYPFLLGEDSNLLYFAQQVHHRPVLAGYYMSGAQERDVFGLAVAARAPHARPAPSPGYITNAMMIDHVFGRRPGATGVRLRTVVDILDPVAVKRSGAEYLILHANLLREFFHTGPARLHNDFVARIRGPLGERYGAPVFENDLITVLRLSPAR